MLEEVINVNNIPTIDLHGESSDIARVLIESFIEENIKLKNYNIAIIHGKGLGILKKTTHEVLRKNKHVLDFKIYYFNDGMTIVKLKKQQ